MSLEPPTELPPVEDLNTFEARVGHWFEPKVTWRFGPLFLDQIDDVGAEFEYLIKGFLSVGDISVIGGPSRSGKSFLAIHAGMCVATGRDFFGKKVRQGLVVYIAGEGARGVKKRLRAWRKHFEVEFARETPFVLLQLPVDLFASKDDTTALITEIENICKLYTVPLGLVAIDTLATASPGADENSFRDVSTVMRHVQDIKAKFGVHVTLIHHLNAGGTKLRGHTSIFANVDNVLLVTRDDQTKIRTVVLDKQKDDEDGLKFQFELKSIELARDEDDNPITSCVCIPVGEQSVSRPANQDKGAELTNDEYGLMKAYFSAEKSYGRIVPTDMGFSSDVMSIVPYEDLKRAWAEIQPNDYMPNDDDTAEQIEAANARHREGLKKRLQRMRESLCRWRVLGTGTLPDKTSVIWYTGKPLRAFPHTWPKDAPPIPDYSGPEAPMPF